MIHAFGRHDFFGTYRDWSIYDTYIWVCEVLEKEEVFNS